MMMTNNPSVRDKVLHSIQISSPVLAVADNMVTGPLESWTQGSLIKGLLINY